PPSSHSSMILLSMPGLVVPQQLVQLQLEAYRQIVGNDPVGQRSRADLAVTGREQHLAGALVEAVLDQLGYRPVVVLARTDDELDLIIARQQLHVLVAVAQRSEERRVGKEW